MTWHIRSNIGDGDSTLFWLDNWCDSGVLKNLFPDLFRLESNKRCSVKDRLYNSMQVTSNWHWKSSPSSDRERDQLNVLSNILSRVKVKEEKDKWWWGDCNDPSPFLVANARKLIEVKMFDLDQFKFPWNRWAPLKINAFVWRASLNRMPTKDALRHRGIMVDPNCPFCSSFTESAGHILIWCGTTVELWNKVMTWCKNSNFNFSSIHDMVLSPEKWAGDKCYKDHGRCNFIRDMVYMEGKKCLHI
ncbi:hypothetical protein E3N88_27965 [Mikania micrantha]|uniref:Reverse transcriptase zinc-binding domain-containing protein n=1 Tax=Mikania micrantha TaxID=192012 RepID=A0A5N6MZR5_9ASTR|nr:hypothetical protein E3N88_27965 [Mikania micrantha]